MKKILFVALTVLVMGACTQTSTECQYLVNNNSTEDIEAVYGCLMYTDHDGNTIENRQTIPAGNVYHLITAEKYMKGIPSATFTYFTVLASDGDTLKSWMDIGPKNRRIDASWTHVTETQEISMFHKHFIERYILEIKSSNN